MLTAVLPPPLFTAATTPPPTARLTCQCKVRKCSTLSHCQALHIFTQGSGPLPSVYNNNHNPATMPILRQKVLTAVPLPSPAHRHARHPAFPLFTGTTAPLTCKSNITWAGSPPLRIASLSPSESKSAHRCPTSSPCTSSPRAATVPTTSCPAMRG